MKSIANQYLDLKEGRLSQANFMRNLRMSMPQYVTNVTSFKDAVRILKGKGILTESGTGDAPISKMSRKEMIDFLGTTEEKDSLNEVEIGDKLRHKLTGAEMVVTKVNGNNITTKITAVGTLKGAKVGDVNKTNALLIGKTYEIEEGLEEAKVEEHHNDPNFPGSPAIHDLLNRVAKDWGNDSKLYNNLEDAVVEWSDRNGNLTPEGKDKIKALLFNWDVLDDYGWLLDPKPADHTGETTGNEDIKENDDYDAKDAADTEAEELAKAAGDYDAAVGMLEDELGLSFGAASAIAARVYPEGGDAEAQAMINKIEKEMAGEEAVKAQYDITEAKQKVNIENIYPTELRMGIKVELEHTDDLDKAKKIALDHLGENPFYYTELKLSGVDTKKETPTKEKKAIAKKKDETEFVDKANQMKPVKGIEKTKASANKAHKETNKPVKGISLMSLIAKTSRGVQKMAATGEKMKVVKESYKNFLAAQKKRETAAETYGGFKKGDEVMIKPDAAEAIGLKANKVYNITDFRVYRKGSILQNVDVLLDNGEEININYLIKAPKVFASSTNLGGYDLNKLKEMIREILDEMNSDQQETDDIALGMGETMDGRDNLTDTAGHQLDEDFDYDFDYQEDKIIMTSDVRDTILDNPELQEFIEPSDFITNKEGQIVLWVDRMEPEQFDKLANLLGIKY